MAGELASSLVRELKSDFLHLREQDYRKMVDWTILFAHAAEAAGRSGKLHASDLLPDGRNYFEVVRIVHRQAYERYGKGPGRDEGAALDHLAYVFGEGLDADPLDEVQGATFPGETLGDIALDWIAACRTPGFRTARDLPRLMQTLARASLDGRGILNPSERLEDGRRIRRIAIELAQDVLRDSSLGNDDERSVILSLARLWQGQMAAPVAELATPCEGGSTIGAHLDAWREASSPAGPRL